MKFKIEQDFELSVEQVENAMINKDIGKYMTEYMNTMISVEPVERLEEGDVLKRKSHYKPEPIIKSVGPLSVKPEWMEWIEHSVYDKNKHEGSFNNIPVNSSIAKKMINKGKLIIKKNGLGCKRIVEGELKVKVLIVGKLAEKVIVNNAKKILNDEASMIKKLYKDGILS